MAEPIVETVKDYYNQCRKKKAEFAKYIKARDSVIWLSWADLKHEWILTLCLIAAITAVLSPLFILFGLKYGLITIYTQSLIQDPVNREIRPLSSRNYSKEWFEEIRAREDVAFLIPSTRTIAATVTVNAKGREEKEDLELIPTAENDPLLIENGAVVPKAGECVLTKYAAESVFGCSGDEDCQAMIGETVVATASRHVGGKYEYGSLELTVAGVLAERASVRNLMYVQLEVLEAVERFKDGRAVPQFDWPGEVPLAYPQYNGLIVVAPQALDEITKRGLAVGTGFTQFEELDNDTLLAKAGFQVSPDMDIYFVSTAKKPVGEQSIKNVQKKLRGREAYLFPYIHPIEAQLFSEAEKTEHTVTLYALSADPETAEKIGLSVVPDWGAKQAATPDLLHIMLPSSQTVQERELLLKVSKEDDTMMMPVTVRDQASPVENVAFVPAKLAGILKLYETRDVSYDDQEQEIVLGRRGYASFRLYADEIYDVENLRLFFEQEHGLMVHSAANEIRKVIQLTTYLNLVFWLIAIVGISGTIAALLASLYASIERKKRDLGVLRLIGLSGPSLFRFPIYQGMLLGVGGFLTGFLVFEVFSLLINALFKPHVEQLLGFSLSLLETRQNLCQIPFSYLLAALTGTIIIAGCAALVAAIQVNRIEPAEALRDE